MQHYLLPWGQFSPTWWKDTSTSSFTELLSSHFSDIQQFWASRSPQFVGSSNPNFKVSLYFFEEYYINVRPGSQTVTLSFIYALFSQKKKKIKIQLKQQLQKPGNEFLNLQVSTVNKA